MLRRLVQCLSGAWPREIDQEARDLIATLTPMCTGDPRIGRIRSMTETAVSLTRERSGDLEAAESFAESALHSDPSYADALVALGLVRLRQGRRAEARDLADRAAMLADDWLIPLTLLNAIERTSW
jgi:Tfp pilus assembly protein PilF